MNVISIFDFDKQKKGKPNKSLQIDLNQVQTKKT